MHAMASDKQKPQPHAVFFQFPMHGHVRPAFQLAKLLHHHRGFHVTFIHTDHNRRRILRSRGAGALAGAPGFRFAAVPDALLPSDLDLPSLLSSLEAFTPHFRSLLSQLDGDVDSPPVTCVVTDMDSILRAAKEKGVTPIAFWTSSTCSLMASLHHHQLVDMRLVPLKDGEELSNGHLDATVIDWLAGMPADMRLRDLPSFIRTTDPQDPLFLFSLRCMDCLRSTPAAVIHHTFGDLDRQLIDAMSTGRLLRRTYAVGPLPLMLAAAATAGEGEAEGEQLGLGMGGGLLEESHDCLQWLHGKAPNSVVYVSFGSILLPREEELAELAWGLANSGYRFLWVTRSDQVPAPLPPELLEERGYVASSCPQEAVLRHDAVGAFLTHSGWNSTLESLCAGVPMLCWPAFADQPTNCRYACTEWRVGLEIGAAGGRLERGEVERLVREVMGGEKGKEMRAMSAEWKHKAALAALPGGPSWLNLDRFLHEVLLLSAPHASPTHLVSCRDDS